MIKRIAVVTGSRAEYGLLKPFIQEVKEDKELELYLIVTGMHLSSYYGNTYQQILDDGYEIKAKVDINLTADDPVSISRSMALGITGLTEVYQQIKPDIVVILGDRFEIMSAAQAAMISRIPIAHIHGGEASEGLIDEAIRHGITKMSHLHFVTTDTYRNRVIQLGESPDRVFNVGALAVDNINTVKLLSRKELEDSLEFSLGECCFLVTYHPLTLDESGTKNGIHSLLLALDQFPKCQVIFTSSNSDTGGRAINQMLKAYVKKNKHRCSLYSSLGTQRYLSAIDNVDVVIGNSSSGLIEAPVMRTPTVNIGERQKGRMSPHSVLNCKNDADEIVRSIKKAMSFGFKQSIAEMPSPYGVGDTARLICNIIKHCETDNLLFKSFHDLEVQV